MITKTKIPYSGKATSLSQQISLFKEAGILIQDEETAKKQLSFVGYYRLFAYVKPLLLSAASKITFEQVWNLYTVDGKLRLLVIEAIESIEVAFRVSISEIMSTRYDPFWYTQNAHFKHLKWHVEFMDKILTLVEQKHHPLIRHF